MSVKTHSSIVEILQQRAIAKPEATAYIFLEDGENKEVKLTYRELEDRVKAIAQHLQATVDPGSRALLVYAYNDSLEFIQAFFGCLYAGVVAVPCHPPMNRLTTTEVQTRLVDAKAEIVLSNATLLPQLQKQLTDRGIRSSASTGRTSRSSSNDDWGATRPSFERRGTDDAENAAVKWLDTAKIKATAKDYSIPAIDPDSLAFLQYTSGSTGEPKGVIITHRCLLQNQEMLRLAFGHDEHSVGVGWLPLFHDMGLIGNVIQTVYLGACCVMMSPVSFVQKPIRWLQAVSKYKVTTSGAPNFAYDLLCDRAKDSQIEQLDLSNWKLAFCGAEPVKEATIERFSQKFATCGFKKSAFYPCYGMAEATLMITGGDYRKPPTVKYVDKIALEENKVVTKSKEQAGITTIVSAGYPWLDGKIAIANPQTLTECAADEVGEIWFASSSVGKGYWQKPDVTAKTFQAILNDKQYLRTGDLGFICDNELYITGRLNDVLVFWGLNHYPQQIERTVEESHEALKPNCGAAISVNVEGKDRLVIVQEIERSHRRSFVLEDVVESIRWAIFQQHFIDVYSIVLLKPGALPKTSSGKVQRNVTKERYLADDLSVMARWSLPDSQSSDMTSLMERYTNPVTYLKMMSAITRGKLRRFFYLLANR